MGRAAMVLIAASAVSTAARAAAPPRSVAPAAASPPPATAGTSPGERAPDITPPASPAPIPQTVVVAARRTLIAGRPVVLAEGFFLVRSRGQIRFDPAKASWIFLPQEFGLRLDRAIAVAPSPALEDIISFVDPTGDAGFAVELTGEILRYRDSNTILPELITPSGAAEVANRSTASPGSESEGDSEGAAVRGTDGDDADQSSGGAAPADGPAAEIERRLRERLGPVARSADRGVSAVEQTSAIDPAFNMRARVESEIPDFSLLRRRGTIVRDRATGGWRFISTTTDGGTPEPTLRILPSSALEQIERTVRSGDTPRAVLLSGRVVRFRGERWIRVTEFALPRSQQGLFAG